MLQLLHKEYTLTFPTLLYGQTLVYTAEQLSELGGRGENENAKNFETTAKKTQIQALSIAVFYG